MGETDYIQGKVDDVIYNLFGIKEPNYVMKIMYNCRLFLADEKCKETAII